MPRSLLSAVAVALAASAATAAPPRPALETAKAVDAEIVTALAGATPAASADDAEFLRRAYLDVTGRIPTAKQAAAFLNSKDSDKRAKLIDELLASPNYGEQFGRTWRDWIAPPELPGEGNGGNQPVQATQNLGKWFAGRFNAGAGWDAIARDVLTANGTLKEQPQGLFFSLVGDDTGKPTPAGAARAVGSLFLGMQLQCAECHDDPFKHHTQADYWGLAAFFRNVNWRFNGRYFDYVSEGAPVAGPKAAAGPKDAAPVGSITIPKAALKNSGKVVAGRFPEADPLTATDGEPLRPKLAAWVATADNPAFARAFVNRTWAYFTSRGFVHPVDDLRADNPPSHPAALKLMTDEFVASGFDVRHLVRCVTLTAAYQRTSRPAATDPPEAVVKFARMPVRVMTADALYDSLKLALADPALDLRAYDAKESARFGESSPVGTAYDEFAKLFATNEDDATDFTHGIPQLLALLNHPRLRTGGKAADELAKARLDPAAATEALYLATLSRRPTAAELGEATAFLARRPDPRRGYAGLLWVLVNRSEFLLVR